MQRQLLPGLRSFPRQLLSARYPPNCDIACRAPSIPVAVGFRGIRIQQRITMTQTVGTRGVAEFGWT